MQAFLWLWMAPVHLRESNFAGVKIKEWLQAQQYFVW